ncbi:hypothetical protein LguiA_025299 [Lonicera macranthoides]
MRVWGYVVAETTKMIIRWWMPFTFMCNLLFRIECLNLANLSFTCDKLFSEHSHRKRRAISHLSPPPPDFPIVSPRRAPKRKRERRQRFRFDEFNNLKASDFELSALPEQVNNSFLHTACETPTSCKQDSDLANCKQDSTMNAFDIFFMSLGLDLSGLFKGFGEEKEGVHGGNDGGVERREGE